MNTANTIFIFIGPEGAGKSTQARMLAKSIGLACISTGDMLRTFAAEDKGFLGDAARTMFSHNGYLDAELINKIVSQTLREEIYTNGAVLDGCLRTYEETSAFDDMLAEAGKKDFSVTVFWIQITEEESIRRLTVGRKRADDTIEGVKRRLAHFHDRLSERLEIIKSRYTLIEINGMQEKENVHEEIMEKIHTL